MSGSVAQWGEHWNVYANLRVVFKSMVRLALYFESKNLSSATWMSNIYDMY